VKYETALVTGGSTGIGAAMVRALVAGGTRVAVCARNADRIDALVAELGDRAVGIAADVSEPSRAEAVVAEAHERLGSLDLVVANAGTGHPVSGPEMTVADITTVLRLNVLGATATIAAGVRPMVERGRGHLVGVSSVAGNRGLPGSAAYCASKAALSVFLESLRVDLRGTGVQVTDIRPGFVDTPLTQKNDFPMPFLMSGERAADLILRALRKNRAVYTFPWQMALGGWVLRNMPDVIYHRLASRFGV
jgi:short-subunit dehydrogenase